MEANTDNFNDASDLYEDIEARINNIEDRINRRGQVPAEYKPKILDKKSASNLTKTSSK